MTCRLCDGGSLLEFFQKAALAGNSRLEQHSALIMSQLLRAVAVCHQNGIMHRDIKLQNIIFSSDENLPLDERLRLADFGSAELFQFGSKQKYGVREGTERFMAPEVFKGTYGVEADIFSCGVVMHILLTQRACFHNMHCFHPSQKRVLPVVVCSPQ
jgi:calcium-dependent protein kinase